jgi:HAD superfamily hydrolase (TIGR01509 family)
MDGTLTRTNELIFASFNHVALKYLGKVLTPGEIVALFGPPEEGGLKKMLGTDDVGEAMEDLCRFYDLHHDGMASLHGGMRDLLDYLRGHGVLVCLFTGKGRRTTEISLRRLGISRFFDLVVSGSDVQCHKPHPDGILRVLETYSLAPSGVLMVGDSLSDVQASKAAGVSMAGALWDSYNRDGMVQAGVDFLFETTEHFACWCREQVVPG